MKKIQWYAYCIFNFRLWAVMGMILCNLACIQTKSIPSDSKDSTASTASSSSSVSSDYVTSLNGSLDPHFAQSQYTFVLNEVVSLYPSFGITIGPDLSFSVSPSLPTGLVLNTATGDVLGTASAITASKAYTFTVTNGAGQTASYQLTMGVFDSVGQISYASASLQLTGLASVTSILPTVTGSNSGTVSISSYSIASVGSAPSLASLGLAFNTSTGNIFGTPINTSSSNSYTVTVADVGGDCNKSWINF